MQKLFKAFKDMLCPDPVLNNPFTKGFIIQLTTNESAKGGAMRSFSCKNCHVKFTFYCFDKTIILESRSQGELNQFETL